MDGSESKIMVMSNGYYQWWWIGILKWHDAEVRREKQKMLIVPSNSWLRFGVYNVRVVYCSIWLTEFNVGLIYAIGKFVLNGGM